MGRTKGSRNGIRRVVIKKSGTSKPQVKYVPTHEVLQTLNDKNGKMMCQQKQQQHETIFDHRILKLYRNKRYEECAQSVEAQVRVTQGRTQEDYLILLAAAHVMMKNFVSAQDILDNVISRNPQSSFAFFNKGVAFYLEQKYDLSISMLDKALLINPSEQMNRAREMKMRIDLENRKAVIVLQKMSSEDLRNCQHLAQNYIESGKIMELNESYEKTPKKKTEGMSTRKTRSDQNDRNYLNIPEALPKSFVPLSSEDFHKKAMEQYTTGCLQLALSSFKKAYELNPESQETEAMIQKIEILISFDDEAKTELEEENYERVVELAKEALEIDETNHYINRRFYYQKGIALFYLGRNEESIKDYAEFERINKIIKGEIDV